MHLLAHVGADGQQDFWPKGVGLVRVALETLSPAGANHRRRVRLRQEEAGTKSKAMIWTEIAVWAYIGLLFLAIGMFAIRYWNRRNMGVDE